MEQKEPKTLRELKADYKALYARLKDYLHSRMGYDVHMAELVITDLMDQMYMHQDDTVNDMVADLINLSNEISYAEKKEAAEAAVDLMSKQ